MPPRRSRFLQMLSANAVIIVLMSGLSTKTMRKLNTYFPVHPREHPVGVLQSASPGCAAPEASFKRARVHVTLVTIRAYPYVRLNNMAFTPDTPCLRASPAIGTGLSIALG